MANGEPRNEQGFFADNYGGLNLTASDINCPYEDSPLMYNVDVNVNGRITKRKGTQFLKSDTSIVNTGVGLIPFITGLRYPFLIEKRGTGLYVYIIDNGTVTEVMSKTNVWSSAAANVKTTYVKTSEIEPRIILCTGVNQPVQLRFVEQQSIASGSGSNYAMSNATRFEYATTSNIVVFKNRVRVTPSSVSYGAGTLTLNGVSYTSGDVIDVILITWQHMVEALRLKGDRISSRATRYHVAKTDQNVEIPASLRTAPTLDYPVPETFGYNVYKSDAWNLSKTSDFTFDTGLNPSTASEYAFGNGARYNSSVGGTITPSPLFITFGDISSGDPAEVFIVRRIDLNPWFNGGNDIAGTALKVYLDNTLKSQHTSTGSGSTTFGDYYLVTSANAIATSTSTACRFITWEAATRMGVPSDSYVTIIHTSTSYIGSSANTDIHLYKDGACEPLYGVGAYFDYYSGAFARNVTIFDNRLIFSGIINNPLLILLSELGDTAEVGRPYRDFQIESANTLATAPFNIPIQSKSDDFTTGMYVWQKSLFILTRQAVFRLYASSGSLSNTNRFINKVSNAGCVNAYSVISTDTSLLYLSDIGVMDLSVGVDSEDYASEEISIKIRPVFGITKNPTYESLPFMVYDQLEQKVYVGMPTTNSTAHCLKLYVFNTVRKAWTEYRTDGSFKLMHMAVVQDFTLGLILVGSHYVTSTSRYLIKFNDSYFLDFRRNFTGDGSTQAFTLPYAADTVTHVTSDQVYGYVTTPTFEMIDNVDVNDVYVTLSGNVLTFGVDYIKRSNNTVYLLQNPGAGQTLIIKPRSIATDYEPGQGYYGITTPIANHIPIHVTVDNVYKLQDQDYTVNNTIVVTFNTAPANNSVITIGKLYKALYTTPLITLGTLTTLKRSKHAYLYFDNELGQEQFTTSDVNTASGQTAADIVGLYKVRMNASVYIQFNSDYGMDAGNDIYGFYSLMFDDSLFDITPSQYQYRRYTLFKEALLGIGYSYRLFVSSYDEGSFTLAAWQITSRQGGEKHINFGG